MRSASYDCVIHHKTFDVARRTIPREHAPKTLWIVVVKHAHAHSRREMRIVDQECIQKSRFVPKEQVMSKHSRRVDVRPIYIVKMHIASDRKARQDLKDEAVHFATGLNRMGRVDEQQISGASSVRHASSTLSAPCSINSISPVTARRRRYSEGYGSMQVMCRSCPRLSAPVA